MTDLRAGGLLRAGRPLRSQTAGPLVLTTMLGAGVLPGDRFAVRGRVGADASLEIGATSATKVYGDGSRESEVDADWSVAGGGHLVVRNMPTVAFDGARFRSRTRIELEPGAHVTYAETIVYPAGASNFRTDVRTIVRRAGRVAAYDALRLSPAQETLRGSTVATLLSTSLDLATVAKRLDAAHGSADVRVGLDVLESGMLFLRLLAASPWHARDLLSVCLR